MTSFMSIGGIASGLDTAGIIDQLLRLERRPIQVIEQRQADHRRADQAWQSVTTKLSGLRSSIDALRDPAAFQRDAKVTSSRPEVAAVRTTGSPPLGSVDVEVQQLATTHSVAVGGSFAGRDVAIGVSELTVTRADGSTSTVALAEGATLEDAARRLSEVEGVQARLVRTGPEAYRLVVGADGTGEQKRFTVTGDPAVSNEVLTLGEDAQLRVGGLDVTRSSNVVDDLIEGVELTLATTGTVRIGVARDLDASVGRVKKLVDGVNGVLDELRKVGATSTDASGRGPLAGDSLVRDLSMQLRTVVSSITGSGDLGTPSAIGISLTRDGRLAFDEAKLRKAMTDDPAAVAAMVSSVTRASDPAVSVTATGRTPAGAYQVEVTAAGTAASRTGTAFTPAAAGTTHSFSLTTLNGRAATLSLDESITTATGAASALTAQLRAAGIADVTFSVEEGALKVDHGRAGGAHGFTISGSGDLGLDGQAAGTDVRGTVSDGTTTWAATGTGTSLRVTEGPATGMVLAIARGSTGPLGQVTVADGLTSAFDRVLRTMEGRDGRVQQARNGIQARIDQAKVSIESAENRFAIRERMLRAQFAGLETTLGRLQSQGNWLAGQIGAMGGGM